MVTAYNTRTGGLIPAHAGKTRRPRRSWRRSWAHPRSRGENIQRTAEALKSVGSSPLTRGKLEGGCLFVVEGGLIPAHAGKTALFTGRPERSWAHPRSRGENRMSAGAYPLLLGSSPLTRGKLQAPGHAQPRGGLIPAHAGKTRRGRASCEAWWAHPRSRGENPLGFRLLEPTRGSSPLTRGKPTDRAGGLAVAGLIPAHAGKTDTRPKYRSQNRAHPRSRGENRMSTGA